MEKGTQATSIANRVKNKMEKDALYINAWEIYSSILIYMFGHIGYSNYIPHLHSTVWIPLYIDGMAQDYLIREQCSTITIFYNIFLCPCLIWRFSLCLVCYTIAIS